MKKFIENESKSECKLGGLTQLAEAEFDYKIRMK